MKIRRKKYFTAEVSTSSLNDIMFFLLLFFLIISTIANPGVIKVMLPKSNASKELTKRTISLSITKEKQYFLDNRPVLFDNLKSELTRLTKNLDEPAVVLKADAELDVQDLVDVIQICANLKVKTVLATRPD